MNGAEAVDRSRDIAPDVPIAIMSGFEPSHIAAELRDGTAVDYLQEPFLLTELFNLVERAGLS